MCHDLDSHPPIAPIAGGALDGRLEEVEAQDGNRFAAFHARPTAPSGSAVVILPDVRGLHPYYEELALRLAERGTRAMAIDWFGRTAGVARRGEAFDHMNHAERTTWAGISADIRAAVGAILSSANAELEAGADKTATSVFTLGFCMGGRMSFLTATLGLGLAGVIGFYGTLVGPWRNDAPAPVDLAAQFGPPVLGLFGGADRAIAAEHVAAFESALTAAGVDHRLVTYPDAPHSFFDRKSTEFAAESEAAWGETLEFISTRTARA